MNLVYNSQGVPPWNTDVFAQERFEVQFSLWSRLACAFLMYSALRLDELRLLELPPFAYPDMRYTNRVCGSLVITYI